MAAIPHEEGSELDYAENAKISRIRMQKRVKLPVQEYDFAHAFEFPLHTLLSVLQSRHSNEDIENNFEQFLAPFLQDFVRARDEQEKGLAEADEEGERMRPLRPTESSSLAYKFAMKSELSLSDAIIARKVQLEQERHRSGCKGGKIESDSPLTLVPLDMPHINPEVLNSLNAIRTTPFCRSFLARLQGSKDYLPPGLLSVDWATRTTWMHLMDDIHDHYSLAHPGRECTIKEAAPITYSTLHKSQLPEVNDLLERSFWSGIDVSDSLDYSPERSTVVAMYKKIVVGIAIISSPIETYITYLAVKAGWDKSQIARTMLYHLIDLNPTRDFTLHVSTNNSAILLYNQFGFKAEKFVAGFYSAYLDPNSRISKNAFMLRLRHI